MSSDIEDLLRDQLRGAASGAPHHLGVTDQDVLTRGRRVIVRRRILTTVGAAAATLAIAGTIGILAPHSDNDALPAIPTPTVTVSTSVSTTTTPKPTTTASPTGMPRSTSKPSRTSPSSTAPGSSSPTPKSTPSGPTTLAWSDPFTVAGASYRTRFVSEDPQYPEANYNIEVQSAGSQRALFPGYFESECCRPESDPSDAHVLFFVGSAGIEEILTVNGQPVSSQASGVTLPSLGRGPNGEVRPSVRITAVRISVPVTLGPSGDKVIARFSNGAEGAISGFPDPD